MSDSERMRAALEAERRSVAPSPGGFDRLIRLRRRRQRNQRMGAAILALALAAAGTWGVAVAFRGSKTPQPARPTPTIDRTSAGALHIAWSGRAVEGAGTPVREAGVGGGSVFIMTHDGTLHAFATACRQRLCDETWQARVAFFPTVSAPVANDSQVFVLTSRLIAFDVRCGTGGATCTPAWTSEPLGTSSFGAPVTQGSIVFVPTARGVEAYDWIRCPRDGSVCAPSWVDVVRGGASGLAVTAGAVVATSTLGTLVFDDPCPQRTCQPAERFPNRPSIQPPAVSGHTIFVSADTGLDAFAFKCGPGRTCPPAWHATIQSVAALGGPVVAGDRVWIAGDRLLGYPITADCAGSCSPVFVTAPAPQTNGYASPALRGGVMFTALGRPLAYDAACIGFCKPIWAGPRPLGRFTPFYAPAVTESAVYYVHANAASIDRLVVAFAP